MKEGSAQYIFASFLTVLFSNHFVLEKSSKIFHLNPEFLFCFQFSESDAGLRWWVVTQKKGQRPALTELQQEKTMLKANNEMHTIITIIQCKIRILKYWPIRSADSFFCFFVVDVKSCNANQSLQVPTRLDSTKCKCFILRIFLLTFIHYTSLLLCWVTTCFVPKI